ncbi:MAG: hypothetical protein ACRCWG_15765 [Sarcina sp.]
MTFYRNNKLSFINVIEICTLVISLLVVVVTSDNDMIDSAPIMIGLPYYIGGSLLLLEMCICNLIIEKRINKFFRWVIAIYSLTFLAFITYTAMMIPKGYRLVSNLEPIMAILGVITYALLIVIALFNILITKRDENNSKRGFGKVIIKGIAVGVYTIAIAVMPMFFFVVMLGGSEPTDEIIKINGKEYIVRDNSSYDFTDDKMEARIYTYFDKVNPILYRENKEIKEVVEDMK